MKTREDFERDFANEINEGVLFIGDEVTEETIFILADGTIIDAEFSEYGDRCTDHHQVLCDDRYSMNEMVTIEPERETIILPIEMTEEQVIALDGLENVYLDLDIIGAGDENAIELIKNWLNAGGALKTALMIVKEGSWSVIDEDDLDDYAECEKENLIYLDNGTIVEVW